MLDTSQSYKKEPVHSFTRPNFDSRMETKRNGETTKGENSVIGPSSFAGGNSINALTRFKPSQSVDEKFRKLPNTLMESRDIIHGATTNWMQPSSLVHGKSISSLYSASTSEVQKHLGIGGDRHIERDERHIYQEALQNLGQPRLEDDLPQGLLAVPLFKHQKIALAWMVQKEKSTHCTGGILADDQGLGKTISMIALIQKQMAQQSKFTSDVSDCVKPEALNLDEDDDGVTEADKTKLQSRESDLKCEKVTSSMINTSSNTRPAGGTLIVCPASVLRQWGRELDERVPESAKLSVLLYHGGTRTKHPNELTRYHVVLTTYSIVTNEVPKQPIADDDEGEQKNHDKYGLCPDFSSNKKRRQSSNEQNNKKKGKKSKESLLDFGSGPLARVRWFRIILDEAQTIKNHRTQVARACCGLRAKRRWCLSGTPMQNTIDDLYSYFRFLKYDPYSVYSSFCASIKHPISRNASSGYKKLQAVLKTVLLRRTKGTIIDGEPILKLPPKSICLKKVEFSHEEREFYLKLEADSRQQFKEFAAMGTLKQNYASILMLLLRLRQACDHPLLVKGFHTDTIGKDSLDMARQLPREMLINLRNQLEGLAICTICSDPPEDGVVSMCGHVFCYQCVSERLIGDTCPAPGCKDILGTDCVFSRGTLKSCICENFDDETSTSSTFDEQQITHSGYVSSKIKAALDILTTIASQSSSSVHDLIGDSASAQLNLTTEVPEKAIVFSQWTSMLDLLELSLNENLIQYRRLDGTMTLVSRDKAVKDFNTDPEVTVMLMSLKAGSLGLNMIAACHVILLDLWWNPSTEDQAIDRAHRIGQTRPVTVSRITVKDTVEDRILALQEEKRKMVSSAFGEDQTGTHATRLTVDDLRYMFNCYD
ncbi:helicase-like transcription factor CHR28 isoform X2 [Zingiber officinale]|nr:helicase-like transcription factor CHR28 isoform X2 [Zingiber officinale]